MDDTTQTKAPAAPAAAPAPTNAEDVYAERRRRLMQRIGPETAALFVSNPVSVRSNDSEYDYRPNSDLLYLTGFEEPEAAALLLPDHPEHPFVLFLRKRDREREIWDGFRVGVEGAKERLKCDAAFPIEDLAQRLPALLEGRSRLVYPFGLDEERDKQVIRAVKKIQHLARRGKRSPRSIVDPMDFLHEMRLVKSPREIEDLRRAVRVSAEGHVRAMRATRPGMREYQIQAEIEYVFKKHGAKAPGYSSIVGAGANACVLHYVDNRGVLNAGDLVLVDAGAEIDWYTGDVTRTWPVSGKFSPSQREIYDLVLRAQMDVIRLVRPGLEYHKLHEQCVKTITEGLVEIGALPGPVDKAIESKAFRKYFMHGTGHWLGIDVHDVGSYARDGEPGRPLVPGMVFTVEPGLYFHADDPEAPDRYRGIGVRIEDDVLVTDDGCEILSRDAPKDPEHIESLIGTGSDPIHR